MPEKDRPSDPRVLLSVGICFMGAGLALSFALRESGRAPVGIGLISLGLIFFAIGAGGIRSQKSDESSDDDGQRPHA